ncbi:MAG: hypothetical protein NTNFB02_32920 [Nitrospira sp.]
MLQLGSPEKSQPLAQFGLPPTYFIVEVPALDKYFLGTIAGSEFKLKHVVDDRVHNIVIVAGTEEPALLVFKRLQPDAAQIFAEQMPR